MTDADFLIWLKSEGALRCVLVEAVAKVSSTETDFYLSSRGYVTGASDTPAHTTYLPVISGGCVINERLSLDGQGASLAFSDIELDNTNGDLDDFLGYIWRNREVRVYLGDMRWIRSDFRLMFDGIIEDLQARDRNVLNLVIRDKLQRLNTPVTETLLGGSTANKDRLIPVLLGECHNIEPLLTNPATLEYQVHGSAMEDFIEVRDNGVVVSVTESVSTGKFTLSAALKGTITCSAQGDKPSTYSNTVSKLVQRLATGYGTDPFDSGDLDATNLSDFDTAHPQPVGVYLTERANVLAVCQQLAASVGAQVVMSATGLLRLIKLGLPAPGTAVAVNDTTMVQDSLKIAQRVPVRPAVRLGYCRNWTVQTALQTGIPAEHKDLYAKEWLTVTSTDSTVATAYKLSDEAVQEDTLLLKTTDAQTEADRRRDLRKVQRTVFASRNYADLMLAELGNAATLTSARFSLSGGVSGQIVAISRDLMAARVDIEVYT